MSPYCDTFITNHQIKNSYCILVGEVGHRHIRSPELDLVFTYYIRVEL